MPPSETGSFTAEGILKEALIRLWEQARANEVDKIGVLTIRMFEAGDAFRLLGAVGAVPGSGKGLLPLRAAMKPARVGRSNWISGAR